MNTNSVKNDFKEPKITKNYENELRKVGFELEFSNIDLEDILAILKNDFNLKVNKINNYFYELESDYGKFVLELDFELLTQQKLHENAKKISEALGISIKKKDINSLEKFIAQLSKDVVPYEISTPPLPLNKINLIDQIVEKLAKNDAKGTAYKFYYAFGLHINVEVVSLEIKSLLAYLRAYVILQDYINKDAKVDLARKITPFIDNFKEDYIKHILNENYNPTQKEFIQDYLEFNPTRNRSLDMLPILAFIDEKQVREVLPEEKIKARPAFHYRLSNSSIENKSWKVAHEWNRWINIENLANDEQSLKLLSKEYLKYLDKFINIKSWEQKISKWLEKK